ncbi:MAG: hypothetical protein KIT33_10310 [Candidatus Kapabacteria bacterium]|nr:hypothetical protein [Ignavibacteriota bacterium]MCW5885351.1 hypothetical protein [Candidatus Kapabacteria bacterium]
MKDEFFSKVNCDRCGSELKTRTMSWFTDETICMDCSSSEDNLKKCLPDNGKGYEGCGYLPTINNEVKQ